MKPASRRATRGGALVGAALAATGALFAVLGSSAGAWAQGSDAKQLFLDATASFADGDYASAERQFLDCRAALGDNAAVDYNLGVTYLRLESLGRARLYLARCLKLAPRDRDAREQLRLVLARLDQPEAPSPSWVHAAWQGLRRSFTTRGAIGVAATLNLLAALAIGAWLLSGRRWLGWVAIPVGLLALAAWSLAGSHIADELSGQRAVVVADGASVRSGPGDEFGEIVRLTEGQAVELLERPRLQFGPGIALSISHDEQGLWCEVRAPSGARGYLRRSLIERI